MNKDEEFQAPAWVRNNEKAKPISRKQKIILTATMLTVFPLCLCAGWFEFGRAQEGHWRAWVYAFEWPFFGAISIYMWRRFMKGDVPKFSIPTPDFSALRKEADEKEKKQLGK
jgi:hypothetical protein